MPLPPAYFVVEAGPRSGETIALGSSPLSLGREALNDLVFAYPEVSRRHARIVPQEAAYAIEDLGSTNGTYVNDQRLAAPRRLEHGDRVRLGETVRLLFTTAEIATAVIADGNQSAPLSRESARPTPSHHPADAAIYEPPSTYQPSPVFYQSQISPTELAGYQPRLRRLFIGCGLATLLLVIACGAGLFWLDANRPDILYGPLRALLQLLGISG
jgi:pSer/pThr/pTyr-binding forkhead associated (FHA) protein